MVWHIFLMMIGCGLPTCGCRSWILPQCGRPSSSGRIGRGRRSAADAAQGGIQAGIQTGIQAQRGRESPGGNGSEVGRTILPSRPSAVHQGSAAYRHGRAGTYNGPRLAHQDSSTVNISRDRGEYPSMAESGTSKLRTILFSSNDNKSQQLEKLDVNEY